MNKLEETIDKYKHKKIIVLDYIKLSELIELIIQTSKEHIHRGWGEEITIDRYNDYYKVNLEFGYGNWGYYTFSVENGKISSNRYIDFPLHEFKWLYALWVCGTRIIDDLKEKDESITKIEEKLDV